QQQQHAMSGARWAAMRPATFTAAQYQELEQQALIYKYLVAGVPVPPDLLLPIRRGFDSLASRFYHHHARTFRYLGRVFLLQSTLGYGSYFGKKLDPEPGRCRRTDGKKWRCSKEAAQDSKYCERHMHRGRNRSRKPVETQLVATPHSHSHSQQLQQHAPAATAAAFHSHSPYPAIASGGGGGAAGSFGLGSAQLHMDNAAAPYATAGAAGNKDFRAEYSAYGFRTSALEEHNQFISAAMDTAMDNYSWRLMPSQPSSFSLASYPMLGTLGDLDQSAICSLAKTEREPLSFGGGGGFEDDESAVKQENQTLRPFFDEWPKDRDSWPELQDHDSNHNSNAFSATKLSISIPVTSSD
uniref:Growth-regulating factor n=1 Tax=Aegilops tauschii subsp. strangulata TaxID=200361 RepID=A0A453CUH9_AEGTS